MSPLSFVSKDLLWDGMYWSFDSLWLAADQGGYFDKGVQVPTFTAPDSTKNVVMNADGTATIKFKTEIVKAEGVDFSLAKVLVYLVEFI